MWFAVLLRFGFSLGQRPETPGPASSHLSRAADVIGFRSQSGCFCAACRTLKTGGANESLIPRVSNPVDVCVVYLCSILDATFCGFTQQI